MATINLLPGRIVVPTGSCCSYWKLLLRYFLFLYEWTYSACSTWVVISAATFTPPNSPFAMVFESSLYVSCSLINPAAAPVKSSFVGKVPVRDEILLMAWGQRGFIWDSCSLFSIMTKTVQITCIESGIWPWRRKLWPAWHDSFWWDPGVLPNRLWIFLSKDTS